MCANGWLSRRPRVHSRIRRCHINLWKSLSRMKKKAKSQVLEDISCKKHTVLSELFAIMPLRCGVFFGSLSDLISFNIDILNQHNYCLISFTKAPAQPSQLHWPVAYGNKEAKYALSNKLISFLLSHRQWTSLIAKAHTAGIFSAT